MAASLSEPVRTQAVRIALAEDEADVRHMMARLLRRLGYEVVCEAANGAELLDGCLSQHEIDVALVDLDMPEVDGLTAAEELAERGIPVVLVSGHPDVEKLVAEQEPIVARVVKPATSAKLKSAIDLALATKK